MIAREVDLLTEFYEAWVALHRLRSEKADRGELESAATDLAEAHLAIETYRKRNERSN